MIKQLSRASPLMSRANNTRVDTCGHVWTTLGAGATLDTNHRRPPGIIHVTDTDGFMNADSILAPNSPLSRAMTAETLYGVVLDVKKTAAETLLAAAASSGLRSGWRPFNLLYSTLLAHHHVCLAARFDEPRRPRRASTASTASARRLFFFQPLSRVHLGEARSLTSARLKAALDFEV